MSILDYPVLGHLVDSEDAEDSQQDREIINVLLYNQEKMINLIKSEDASLYDIKLCYDMIKTSKDYYWSKVYRFLIRRYHLNVLKFENDNEYIEDLENKCMDLIYFLKCDLKSHLRENPKIKIGDMSESDIRQLILSISPPSIMEYSIHLMDNESVNLFKNTLSMEMGQFNIDF